MTTLVDVFLSMASRFGDRVAIAEDDGTSITYAELARSMHAYAAVLRDAGVEPGDRVLVTAPISIAIYVALAAVWKLGASAVLPEPAMGVAGVRHAARAGLPKAWIAPRLWRTSGWLFPETRRIPLGLSPPGATPAAALPRNGPTFWSGGRPDADSEALVSFTSGSTGAPKGISRSHSFLMAQSAALEPLLRPSLEGDVDLVGFPVFVLAGLGLGTTSVLPGWNLRDPNGVNSRAVMDSARCHGVTRMLLPPSICASLAEHPFPIGVRVVMTGGGPVYPDLLLKLGELVPKAVAVYGSTEAEPISHLATSEVSPSDWLAMRSGGGILAGKPVPSVQLRLDGDEILVAGRHVNPGYLDPSRNASTKVVDADGVTWHRTGDAGRLDESGRLWLLGRLEGVAGGLHPFAVESSARLWPGVSRAALCEVDGRAVLALCGRLEYLDDWRKAAMDGFGIRDVIALDAIPLDRRHGSKVNYPALKAALKGRLAAATRAW